MRRPLALAFTLLFSWMLIGPLFASDNDAQLPPCCRRHGKHHCSMMEPLTGTERGVQTLREKCPFSRTASSTAHTAAWQPEAALVFFAQLVSHPAQSAQTEALCRLSLDRSRMKRGPPAGFFPLSNS